MVLFYIMRYFTSDVDSVFYKFVVVIVKKTRVNYTDKLSKLLLFQILQTDAYSGIGKNRDFYRKTQNQ